LLSYSQNRFGEHEVPINQHTTRWLGVWIDSKMTLKENQSASAKKAQRVMQYIRRLTGQIALVAQRYTGPSCGGTTGKGRG